MAPIILYLYLAFMFQWGDNPMPLTGFVLIESLLLIICLLFFQLTVEIRKPILKISYGIGLIRFNFQIDQIESVEVMSNPWYYGWGIRITPNGMLYNIHGRKAVKINYLRNGKSKSVMVGTAEPEVLKRALEESWA